MEKQQNNMWNKIKNILPKIYIVWFVVSLLIVFGAGKFSNDNITHIILLIILILSLYVFKFLKPKNPGRFFIVSCVILASLGEGTYMISKPVRDYLIITKDSTVAQFFHNYAIDLILTVPIYILIFSLIWALINKYKYSKWEYIFFMALGQAMGDGNSFFLLNPGMLLFVPFIMLNYHAMNVAPFLSIQNSLIDKQRSDSNWKYPVTVITIIFTYFVGGTFIGLLSQFIK